jgi:hypothetical protein
MLRFRRLGTLVPSAAVVAVDDRLRADHGLVRERPSGVIRKGGFHGTLAAWGHRFVLAAWGDRLVLVAGGYRRVNGGRRGRARGGMGS